MLSDLSIRNFGIIESVDLSFGQGLTVITGETGAGKSMIMDAIGLLIGARGSADFVRHGTSKAEIEGMFLLDSDQKAAEKLADLGIEPSEGTVILRREIASGGKSVCRINGKMMTLAALKEVGHCLIDIHGQHEHQDLLQTDRHLPLLDSFGGAELQSSLNAYKQIYDSYQKLDKQIKELTENEKDKAQRLDFIQFQIDEINRAALQSGEDEALEGEKRQLANYEKIFQALQEGYSALYGEQKGLDWVSRAMSELESITELDDTYKQTYDQITDSYYLLEEMTFSLRDTVEQLEYHPERLEEIEERLGDIQTLKRKYGESVDEILQFRDEVAAEAESASHRDEQIEALKNQLEETRKDLLAQAKALSERRQTTAKKWIRDITRELKELYMAKTQFDIRFSNKEKLEEGKAQVQFLKDGIDTVEFLISTNPGEPLKPLSKVASGGELSRMMLALKSTFTKEEALTSIIFDEVDTGVSGRVAQAMAEKIFKLSAHSQVFCITHLPQVAAMADTHLYITKNETDQRTTTSVHSLSQKEKVDEVGRMISGVEVTDLTKRHAKELLELATDIKATS